MQFASHKLLGAVAAGRVAGGGEAPLDSDSEEVASLALRCLAHMFTWIQLSSNVSSREACQQPL